MNSVGIAPPLILLTKSKPFARRRLDVDGDDPVLAGAAGLADEPALHLVGRAANRLSVGNLGPADVCVDLVFAEHAVDQHLQVQLAHPGDLGLTRLLVGADLERRVLLGQAAKAVDIFSWSAFVLGSIATLITGSGNMIVSS